MGGTNVCCGLDVAGASDPVLFVSRTRGSNGDPFSCFRNAKADFIRDFARCDGHLCILAPQNQHLLPD